MDAVTYPDDAVTSFMNRHLVPLRIPSDQQPLAGEYGVTWTPALFILDREGRAHQAAVGFFNPDEFIPWLLLGIGNMYFHQGDFTRALDNYATILTDHADSDAAPEALFQTGVARYKNSGDPKPLKDAYEQLKKVYPKSTWTKRAYPYRLIQ